MHLPPPLGNISLASLLVAFPASAVSVAEDDGEPVEAEKGEDADGVAALDDWRALKSFWRWLVFVWFVLVLVLAEMETETVFTGDRDAWTRRTLSGRSCTCRMLAFVERIPAERGDASLGSFANTSC